jgi:hypothetical protein
MKEAAGYAPIAISELHSPGNPAHTFVAGQPVKDGVFNPTSNEYFSRDIIPPTVSARIVNDDWPYLYVKPLTADIPYLFVLLVVSSIAIAAGYRTIFRSGSTAIDWQLFLLGAGFILLELQSISRLSLVYGNTWLTTSIVVNCILVMILGANFVILKLGAPAKQHILHAALIATLLLSYFLPLKSVLQLDIGGTGVGTIVVTAVTMLPMFVAGLLFATVFGQVGTPARSFAFNLLGSVAGGLLEYISIYFGINSLVLFAALFYACSYVSYLKGTASSDTLN